MELMSTMSRGTGRKPGDKLNPDGEVINASAALQKMWGRSEKRQPCTSWPTCEATRRGRRSRRPPCCETTHQLFGNPTLYHYPNDKYHKRLETPLLSIDLSKWKQTNMELGEKGLKYKREGNKVFDGSFWDFDMLPSSWWVCRVCRVWRRGLASFILYPTKSKSSADSFVSSLNDSYRPRDALQYIIMWLNEWVHEKGVLCTVSGGRLVHVMKQCPTVDAASGNAQLARRCQAI